LSRWCAFQLRQKIEVDPERPQYVLRETGGGYLRAADEASLRGLDLPQHLKPAFYDG
jgi:hypothetical protein